MKKSRISAVISRFICHFIPTKKYSPTIQLNRKSDETFGVPNIINPFYSSIEFEVASLADARIDVELIDQYGKTVRKNNYFIHSGVTALSLPETEALPSGTYIFRIKNNELIINRKMLKRTF